MHILFLSYLNVSKFYTGHEGSNTVVLGAKFQNHLATEMEWCAIATAPHEPYYVIKKYIELVY